MKSAFKKEQGMSLIEVILVIMVGTSILLISLQQYLSFRRDSDMLQVRYNVDTLFHGLANYFRANCSTDSTFKSYYFPGSLAVDMNTLSPYLSHAITPNPLVDGSGPGGGYIMQFNQYHISSGTNPPLPQRTVEMSTASGGGTANVGYINVWQAQVAVNLLNPSQAQTYKQAMGADCISTSSAGWGGTIVTPCENAPSGATNYLVWSRAPSFSNSAANSTYWLTMPYVKTFTQMYQTDPILVLTDQTQTANQYYRCGS